MSYQIPTIHKDIEITYRNCTEIEALNILSFSFPFHEFRRGL